MKLRDLNATYNALSRKEEEEEEEHKKEMIRLELERDRKLDILDKQVIRTAVVDQIISNSTHCIHSP